MTDLFALFGLLLVAGATWRWGRAGAVVSYLVGAGLCIAAWVAAAWLTTRLDGAAPGPFSAALEDGLTPAIGLVVVWLLVASAGVVLGALARAWRRRERVQSPAP